MLTSTSEYPMSTVAGLEANTLADGFFHATTWIFVTAGSFVTVREWRAGRMAPPWRVHTGNLLIGWDLGFLAFGAALILAGALAARMSPRFASPR